MLGLPDAATACLFDLDGVLTRTAVVHAAAWKAMFDEFLREREGASFRPFDPVEDYDEYVDGNPATTARGRSWSHAASRSRRARTTTRRARPPCTA